VYNGPVGSNQVHDYNPHNGGEQTLGAPPFDHDGVFWTMLLPRDSVEVHLGAGQASFRLRTPIFDDHDFMSSVTNKFPSAFPQIAEVTFDVEWSGILDAAHVRNEDMQFEGDFLQTGSTIRWSSANPSGFLFTSEAPNPARVVNALIGHERNGVFFE